MPRQLSAFSFWLLTFAVAPAAALACPLCKDAITNDPVAAAFNGTTLLMIGAPIALVAAVGGWIAYVYWRSARRTVAASGWAWRGKESAT